jgi:2-dehydropantoate 2-reductase
VIFIGGGAVGSYIGGWLSHLGHDVHIIDSWHANVNSIRENGLYLKGPHEPFVVFPETIHLHENERLARSKSFDIGFICVKAYDTEWAAKLINRFVKEDGYLVSAQNTVPDKLISNVVGENRCIGLVMSSISVASFNPGKVTRSGTRRRRDTGHLVFRAGENNGTKSDRLHELIELLDPIDGGRITTNLKGERWGKLCQNAMTNPVSALSDMSVSNLNGNQSSRQLQILLANETVRVGKRLKIDVVPFGGIEADTWADADQKNVYKELDRILAEKTGAGDWRPSMAQDVLKGRPTEIMQMNGFVSSQGKSIGINTPINDVVTKMIIDIDKGLIKPSFSNIDKIMSFS